MTQQPNRARNRSPRRLFSPLARCLPWAVAALTFGAAASAQAANPYEGEGAAIHGAAPVTQFHPTTDADAALARAVVTAEPAAAVAYDGAAAADRPLARSDVRSSAKRWKQANIATPSGEIGDTAEVLHAREDFYALQTDVHESLAAAEAERVAAAQALQSASSDDALAEAGSDWVLYEVVAVQAPPAEQPADEREIHVRPEMTIGELMSYLGDTPPSETVTVLMVAADEDVD